LLLIARKRFVHLIQDNPTNPEIIKVILI